ncbi:LOW QUALITY PROTEIN: hypothetical protein U9M48_005152 [Paspalum notatum var. saurae]|uniref:Uncharacterized protein n=1 Tax=Paspalum notatum var. saurae TaxID=547442 RepID=A0AAQ3PQ75_PASNO
MGTTRRSKEPSKRAMEPYVSTGEYKAHDELQLPTAVRSECRDQGEDEDSRVEEVLEEPGAEDGDGALGEAALGAPRAALHHAELLQRALLPELVVDRRREPTVRPAPPATAASASSPSARLAARTCAAIASRRHRNCREMVRSASAVYVRADPAPAAASNDDDTACICPWYCRILISLLFFICNSCRSAVDISGAPLLLEAPPSSVPPPDTPSDSSFFFTAVGLLAAAAGLASSMPLLTLTTSSRSSCAALRYLELITIWPCDVADAPSRYFPSSVPAPTAATVTGGASRDDRLSTALTPDAPGVCACAVGDMSAAPAEAVVVQRL